MKTSYKWKEDYQPRLHPKRIMWCTNYWDGPLGGYCTDRVGNDIYYFECVEEAENRARTRMYAVYELSRWEQFKAVVRYAKWIATVRSKWLWTLYMFSYKRFLRRSVEDHRRLQEQWRTKHKLLGYFND